MSRTYLLFLSFLVFPLSSYAAATGEPQKLSAWATVKRRLSTVAQAVQRGGAAESVDDSLPAICQEDVKDEDLLLALKARNDSSMLIEAVKNRDVMLIHTIKPTPDMVTSCDPCGKSALHYAATGGMRSRRILQLLLDEYKGNPDVVDVAGNTPLHLVVSGDGDLINARTLLERRAVLNVKNTLGKTPLMLAAERNNLGVVCEILKNPDGIETKKLVSFINTATDDTGKTALHFAVQHDYQAPLVALLCRNGADLTLQDKAGQTAEQYARECKNMYVADYLQNYVSECGVAETKTTEE